MIDGAMLGRSCGQSQTTARLATARLAARAHYRYARPMIPWPTLDAMVFATAIGPSGPLFGLDVGTKTIGIAVSDPRQIIASALDTIRRRKFREDAAALLALCANNHVCGLVIGLPRNLDGTEGPRAQSTRAFARSLVSLTSLPMLLWDERWSTAAAERTLLEADASRRRRAEVIDKMAAAFILQGALDRLRHAAGRTAADP